MAGEIKEMLGEVLQGLLGQGRELVKDMGYDAALDAVIDSYEKLLVAWGTRYLQYNGTDPAMLARHRKKFCRMARMSCKMIGKVDEYVTGHYRDVWGEVYTLLEPPIKNAKTGDF